MQATLTLMDEHRVIEGVLEALQTGARRLQAQEDLRPAFFLNAVLFIKNFADGCHHAKEEGLYFKAMAEAGMPADRGPVGAMLAEHTKAREFTAALAEAAKAWERGDTRARYAVTQNALGYTALLAAHIRKEDTILYPLAEKGIPEAIKARLEADFAAAAVQEAGSGVQEKYRALAEVLAGESTRRISS